LDLVVGPVEVVVIIEILSYCLDLAFDVVLLLSSIILYFVI
jgi:hypothetical protein